MLNTVTRDFDAVTSKINFHNLPFTSSQINILSFLIICLIAFSLNCLIEVGTVSSNNRFYKILFANRSNYHQANLINKLY